MIQPCEERHCSAKYLRLLKAVNVVGESACKEDIGDNADAGTVAHRAPSGYRRLKYVQSPAVAGEVESITMETEDARMLQNCVSMENLAQSPLDGSSSDGTSTLAVPIRSLKTSNRYSFLEKY